MILALLLLVAMVAASIEVIAYLLGYATRGVLAVLGVEAPDAFEVGAVLLFLGLLILCLAPIVERAESVFAFFDIIDGRY